MRNLFVRAVTSHRNARLKSAAQSSRIVRSQLFLKRAIILLSIGPAGRRSRGCSMARVPMRRFLRNRKRHACSHAERPTLER